MLRAREALERLEADEVNGSPQHDDPLGIARKRSDKTSGRPQQRRLASRHVKVSWVVPLLICGVFVVLIAGTLVLRPLVIRLVDNDEKDRSIDAAQTQRRPAKTAGSLPPPLTLPASDASQPQPARPSDPPVLTAAEARRAGRKLPATLLVGPQPDMFENLENALKAAIAADTIELRTNEPLYVAGDTAVWSKVGSLVIRSGAGFAPVIVRKGNAGGPLLTIGTPGGTGNLLLEGITFVNIGPPAGNSSSKSSAVHAMADCQIRRCVFITSQHSISFHYWAPAESTRLIEDCYFVGQGGQYDMGVGGGRGLIVFRNNLCVRLGKVVVLGGGLDRLARVETNAVLENNTLVRCAHTLFVYAKVRVTSRRNIDAFRRYGYGWGSVVANFQEAQERIEYQGHDNLYHRCAWGIWQVGSGFDTWQRLTGAAEVNALQVDPGFINAQLAEKGDGLVHPPERYRVASRLATAGRRGADLSRIPAPPPNVNQLLSSLSKR